MNTPAILLPALLVAAAACTTTRRTASSRAHSAAHAADTFHTRAAAEASHTLTDTTTLTLAWMLFAPPPDTTAHPAEVPHRPAAARGGLLTIARTRTVRRNDSARNDSATARQTDTSRQDEADSRRQSPARTIAITVTLLLAAWALRSLLGRK